MAPSYGQNDILSVGSITDKTGRQPTKRPPPKKRPYLGSQGHVGPQTGFTGSAFSMRSNLVGGRFAQSGPKTGQMHFLVFLARFGPPTGSRNFSKSPRPPKPHAQGVPTPWTWQTLRMALGSRNFSKSPRPPKTSKLRISRKGWVEAPNVAQRDCGSAEPKFS